MVKMGKHQVFGAWTNVESERERKHKALARRVAAEGIVLLKNDRQVLPLENKKIALYGPGSRMTVKGGRGSGDVRERHSVTIEEGLVNQGFEIVSSLWMKRFEEKYNQDVKNWHDKVEENIKGYSPLRTMDMFIKIGESPMPYPQCTPILSDELSTETDTAIYVLARQAGEGDDRRLEKGEYYFSDVEVESLKLLSEHYAKLILVLNCGSVVDLSILDEVRIDALLFFAQGGMEGGNALADILTGRQTPCGKLTDTWVYHYEDYPFAKEYSYLNGNTDYEEYKEGIYVGYRYFSTFDVKPRYCFGYGLSYTEFEHNVISVTAKNSYINLHAVVANKGTKYAGREIVQAYIQKPNTNRDHEKFSLVAFEKTKELQPKEEERLTLRFDLRDIADFNEEKGGFELSGGEYGVYVGTSVADLELCAVVLLDEDTEVEKVKTSLHKDLNFTDLSATREEYTYSSEIARITIKSSEIHQRVYEDKPEIFSQKIEQIYQKLGKKEKAMLVTGGGYSINCYNNVMGAAGRTCTKLLKKGIPNIVMADGPAGLNVIPETVIMKDGSPRYPNELPKEWQWGWLKHVQFLVKAKPGKGRPVFRYMTAWPSATLQAQTWDTQLLEAVGRAVGEEMLEIGVSVWLAPGMNIHRNPLCGRNFEYYSEDPFIAGKMASSITRGVQECKGVGVTIKHFCCNNQEDNRIHVSERLSERALREIYLRGFRIAITEGKPWTVMSSYNQVNDSYVCNSKELCTQVLRQEWGYEGLVMSDWNAVDQCSYQEAIKAGNDLIMPGTDGVQKQILESYTNGQIDETTMEQAVKRVLRLIYNSATCSEY